MGGFVEVGEALHVSLQWAKSQNGHYADLATTLMNIGDLPEARFSLLERSVPLDGRGREFESRCPRHSFQTPAKNRQSPAWSVLVQLGHCLPLL